jgi:hypothetical protein
MKNRVTMILGALALVVTLGLAAAPADASPSRGQRTDWPPKQSVTTELSLVHGVPNLRVDIDVVKNFSVVRKLANVNFGTAADLNSALPGFVTPGLCFTNDVTSTLGGARVTTRHTAVAPTVGVYANGAVGVPPAFSNGQTASAVVPAGTYGITVTAPNTPASVLANLGDVTLPAETNTLAFAIGTYPSTFQVVTLQIPTDG